MRESSLDAAYFEKLYAENDDPWDFAQSRYERDKYHTTIAMLRGAHFERALEIGCSVGVLTSMLAPFCAELLAVDINPRALETARRRNFGVANVRFAEMAVPGEFPDGSFDLVLVSEVAYYWSDADLAGAIDRIAAAAPGGIVELVHFLPKVADYVRDGDAVHAAFLADGRFERRSAYRHDSYRIDVLSVP
jgi:SAM-dependent methyltransferase